MAEEIEEVFSGNGRLKFLFVFGRLWQEELGAKSEDQLHFTVKVIGNIHYKIGFEVVVLYIMVHRLRSPAFLGRAVGVFGFNFCQSGVKAGIGYQLGCSSVIGMAVVGGIGEHDLRLARTDGPNDFQEVFGIVGKKTILHFEVSPKGSSHNPGSFCRFAVADFCCAAGAQFAAREVEQSDGFALVDMPQQSAGAAEFHIVGVYANGQNIYLHVSTKFKVMMKPLWALFVCCCLAIQVQAQPASALTLLWEYNRGDERYSGSWVYADSDGAEYALLGTKNGTAVYRLDPPFVEVGFIPGPISNWREITVAGDHAFVVTEGSGVGQGMQVISLENLPDSVSLAFIYTESFVQGHIIQKAIFESTPYVYVCGTSTNSGVHILDVSDPEFPVEVGVYQPGYYIHDCHVRGNLLFALAFYQKQVDILDISNPAEPLLIGVLEDPGSGTHSCSTSPDGDFLFLADEVDGQPGRIFDISDLEDMQLVATYTANTASLVHNPYIQGDFAFVSHNTEGLRIIDFRDPRLPVEVGYYDTYAGPSGGFQGLWSACPYLPSGRIVGADRTRGLMVWAFDTLFAGRIYGRITDGSTGLPLPDAVVAIPSPEDTLQLDFEGNFKKGLLPGAFTIQASHPGYLAFAADLSIAEKDSVFLEITLWPEDVSSYGSVLKCPCELLMEGEKVRVECPFPLGEARWSVVDQTGRTVWSDLFFHRQPTALLSLPEFPRGLYYLKVMPSNGISDLPAIPFFR